MSHPTLHAARVSKLRSAMKKASLRALVVTKRVNVTYLTGFTGDDSFLWVSDNDLVVLSDFRFIEQLQEECPDVDVEIRRQGIGLVDLVRARLRALGSGSVGVEADSISLALWQQLDADSSGVQMVGTRGLVETLREIKDRDEIDLIRRSIFVAQRAFDVVRASLQENQTERYLGASLEFQVRQMGGEGCSFTPIVGVGARAALPHAVATERQIHEADFVLFDWGARVGGYASDLTRVLVTGRISPKLERVYGVVLAAQQAAIDAIRPGVLLSEVDAVARRVIAEAGHADHFGHGLGHGIGLEIHESPRLAVLQDRPIKAGMVVTVEPGIYLPGWGGVRIEDDVLVTRHGHEVLSSVPKDLDACVVRWR